jgi:hypothetical protein
MEKFSNLRHAKAEEAALRVAKSALDNSELNLVSIDFVMAALYVGEGCSAGITIKLDGEEVKATAVFTNNYYAVYTMFEEMGDVPFPLTAGEVNMTNVTNANEAVITAFNIELTIENYQEGNLGLPETLEVLLQAALTTDEEEVFLEQLPDELIPLWQEKR